MKASGRRAVFLAMSAELTGYSEVDLEGTGNVDSFLALFEAQTGPTALVRFWAAAAAVLTHSSPPAREAAMRIDVLPSPTVWPMCVCLISLWYQGYWPALPASWYAGVSTPTPAGWSATQKVVPSAQAYTEQLAFRAAGAHPPGANPTGYGSWSIDPVFGDDVTTAPLHGAGGASIASTVPAASLRTRASRRTP
jgi:hypothetical protein